MAQDGAVFKSQLLFSPYVDVLNYLAKHAKEKGLMIKKCVIIYTWPITQEEQGLHELVLRMSEDLKYAGITAFMDLTYPKTQFETGTITWIRQTETVLLMGSPSYRKRAADTSTLTHKESLALSSKHAAHPSSVLPLLLAGNFLNAFPPGYNSTLGADISTMERYFQNFPDIIATLLKVQQDNLVKQRLRKYRRYTEDILKRSDAVPEKERAKLIAQAELQQKSYSAKVLVLKARLTPVQLSILDGKISECDRQINEYCNKKVKGWDKIEVPCDNTESPPPTSSLEQRLLNFLRDSPERVLLLQAPPGAHKTQAALFTAFHAWRDLGWVPVVVDLTQQHHALDDQCVAQTLRDSHLLDDAAIAHAQATRSFLIVVQGFDKSNCTVNVYVRSSLKNWNGKVVFTCRSAYIGQSAQGPFYFMPADNHQRPQPQALKIISYSTIYSELPSTEEEAFNAAAQVHESLLNEAAVNKPNIARERWRRAYRGVVETIRKKSFIFQFSLEQRARLQKGFLMLQEDIVRPIFEELMGKLAQLKGGDFSKQAFISYAWPVAKPDCTALQARLLLLVQDMAFAGIEVLLDILRLTVGVDINEFMKTGVEKSDSIFWIGTPRLVERISFNDDATAANPATAEFCHIVDKIEHAPTSICSLLFLGDSAEKSFPINFETSILFDFRKERDYFRVLPQLAAYVLEISDTPEYAHMYSEYCARVREQEATITTASVLKRLDTAEKEVQQQAAKMEERLKHLLSQIPEKLLLALEGTKEAQVRAFHSLLDQIRTKALTQTAEAQGLDLYIPLKGGAQLDTPPDLYFDVENRVTQFLEGQNSRRVMLIQAGPGAGKTLFGRFLERSLWRNYHTNSFIPIFVSLPKAPNPHSTLVQDALQDLGFYSIDAEHLFNERLVFILDGLDELPLEEIPKEGIIIANQIMEYSNARVLITCRNSYLTALEQKFGVTAHQHLTQQRSLVEDVFLMPFDNSQINHYLAEYCRSPDAEWNNWRQFRNHIDKIAGLSSLSQNPFMLRLLTNTLPRLLTTRVSRTTKVEAVDVYKAFTELWFERETWKQIIQHTGIPPSENRVRRYQTLSQQLGQALYHSGATRIHFSKIQLSKNDRPLLGGLPIHQTTGNISFIHKSVQEFFTASAWISSFASTSLDSAAALLGARLATSEAGLLAFVSQLYNYHTHHSTLVQLVLESRKVINEQDQTKSIAAANAITILNSTRFSFSGMDLSGVNIRGANLDGGLLHNTNLANADLTDVSMREVWAVGADLSKATLSQVWFGRAADVVLNGQCCGVNSLRSNLIAMTSNGGIYTLSSREVYIPLTTAQFTCFAVSNDVLFAATSEGTICTWDIAENALIVRTARVHGGRVLCITVFAGRVITGSTDNTICVWDIASGSVTRRLHGHTGKVLCVKAVPGRIFSGGDEGIVRMWNLASGEQYMSFFVGASVLALDYFDGKIFAGVGDATIHIWDAVTYKQVGEVLQGHTESVTAVCYFEGKIISGSMDGTVRVWDVSTGKQVGDLMATHVPVMSLVVCNRKVYVASYGSNKIQVWDISSKPQLQADESLRGFAERVNGVTTFDGKIAFTGDKATIQVVDAVMPRMLMDPLKGHNLRANCVIEHKGFLISAGGNELIKWDKASGEMISRTKVGHIQFLEVCGEKIVVAGWDGMSVHYINSNQKFTVVVSPVFLMATDFHSEIAAVYTRKTLELFDIRRRRWIGDLGVKIRPRCITCSYGYLMIGIGFSPEIEVWQLQNRKYTTTLHGHAQPVIRMSSFGGKMASSDSHTVCVWNLATMQRVCVVHVTGDITALAVGEEWLVVASGEPLKRQKCMVRWWKVDEKRGKAFLAGGNPARWPLNVRECNTTDAKGLSTEQHALLQQLGAKNIKLERTVSLKSGLLSK